MSLHPDTAGPIASRMPELAALHRLWTGASDLPTDLAGSAAVDTLALALIGTEPRTLPDAVCLLHLVAHELRVLRESVDLDGDPLAPLVLAPRQANRVLAASAEGGALMPAAYTEPLPRNWMAV